MSLPFEFRNTTPPFRNLGMYSCSWTELGRCGTPQRTYKCKTKWKAQAVVRLKFVGVDHDVVPDACNMIRTGEGSALLDLEVH